MNEKDFERIGQLVAQIVDSRLERIDARFEQIDARFEQIDARFEQIDARFEQIDARFEQIDARFEQIDARFEQIDARFGQMDAKFATFKSEIISEFNHSLKLQSEGLSHKFELLGDGIADVIERVVEVKSNLAALDAKVEKLDLRLIGHERQPGAHKDRGGYRVKEGEAGFGDVPRGENNEAKSEELWRRIAEMRRKDHAVTEEINAIYAENGVEPPKIDYDEYIRKSRLDLARDRVEQELKRRREEEQKP